MCVLFPTVLCCDMEHGAQMSVTLCCLLQHKTKGSFTAFSASFTEKADNSKPLHQNFRLFRSNQRPTNKLVTAWCCFPRCWVVTWHMVLKSLCTWVVGVTNEVWCFACSNIKRKEISRRSVQFPLKKAEKSKALHQKLPASQQATND